MAKKKWNWTNNKLSNAIRAAGWNSVGDFCKDFNIQASTFYNWTGGKLSGIFDSRINPLMVSELCKIFDCSQEDLNNMVHNAYRVKHGHPEEEPEKVPLGDKDKTFARYLAYDQRKKEESSNGEIPLEDFIKNENPDFFDEYSGIKAEIEDDRDSLVEEDLNVKKPDIKPIMDRDYMVDEILDNYYGKIPYRDFISLGNVLRDWARFNR